MKNEKKKNAGTEFRFGGDSVRGSLLWSAAFQASEPWLFEFEKGGTREFGKTADGQACLRIDCAKKLGATGWIQREFPGDLVIEFEAIAIPPADCNNLNLFFCARSLDGQPLSATTRSGTYSDYHVFPNYIFTFVTSHSRVRRDPGFEIIGEVKERTSKFGVPYRIVVAKTGGRIRTSINDEPVHDVTDPNPHGAGWVGLRTWNTHVEYRGFHIYAVV
ncbi:MAG TPA: DUF6250 domain-containing protein [Planctomycetota bacterium]|jgi:hypothetical protein|nr:DUF6250 domain-containing protein [Planctomycetota bacterium]